MDPKQPKQKLYKPPVEEYAKDMAVMLDHIFSYEFKTTDMGDPKKNDDKKVALKREASVLQEGQAAEKRAEEAGSSSQKIPEGGSTPTPG